MLVVTETTHHGDYRHERTVELPSEPRAEHMLEMFAGCPYILRISEAHAAHYAETLPEDRVLYVGWTTYTVTDEIDDAGPCCYGIVTSRGQVHEHGCPAA